MTRRAPAPRAGPPDGRRRWPRRLAALALLAAVVWAHLEFADGLVALGLGADPADAPPRRIEVAFVQELQPTAPAPVVAAPPAPPPRAAPAVAAAASAAEADATDANADADADATPPADAAEAAADTAEVAEAVDAAEAAPPPAAEPEAGVGPQAAADAAADGDVAAAAEAARRAASAAEALVVAAAAGAADAAASAAAADALAAAAAPADAASAAPEATVFEWPLSTRLTYTLRGNYRGPIEGHAVVDWLRTGSRYQVHLDVVVGPPFAPLMTRRMSSDGELGVDGLRPERYDEETRVAFRETRRQTIRFGRERVLLPGDKEVAAIAGLQDTASQFVQLTWLFTLRPQLLQPGGAVEVPLALPRRIGRWTYDVVGEEALATPVGTVMAVKLRPRPENLRPGELSIETWFAPTLQYLPVRILIRQDAQTHVDLLIEKLPQQAAAAAPRRTPPATTTR